MAQVAEMSPEGRKDNALLPHISLSTKSDYTKAHLDPNILSEMAYARSPSTSPSRLRESATSAFHPDRMSRPTRKDSSDDDLQSREPSQDGYILDGHRHHDDFRIGKDEESTKKLCYYKHFLEASNANVDSNTQRETITTPSPEAAEQLTPFTDTSSKISEYGVLEKLPVPNSSSNSAQSTPEEHLSCPTDVSDAIEGVDSMLKEDSPHSKSTHQELSSDEEDYMDNVDYQSESEDNSCDEGWVTTNKDFGARVLRATDNNFGLAARLIPQLYDMFQKEKSPVVGFWQASYHTYTGNPSEYATGTSGGGFNSSGTYTGQNTNQGKRKRGNDEGNGEGSSNNRDGDGDGDGGNTRGSAVGGPISLPLACPFNKRDPLKYNAHYGSPNGKGVYKTCESGFYSDHRRDSFREHLIRAHRYNQCPKCSLPFTGPDGKRVRAYQTHLSSPTACSNDNPPDVNEGITEVQWLEIETRQKTAKTVAKSSNQTLGVVKWRNVWNVLFPNVTTPPYPWYTPNIAPIQKRSNLEVESNIFKDCYISGLDDNLDPLQNAVNAFEAWFVKRRMDEEPVLHHAQEEQMDSVTIEEYEGAQIQYSSREAAQLDQQRPSNGIPFQGPAKVQRATSHQDRLESSSSGPRFQQRPPPTKRYATDPTIGHHASGYMTATPQPLPTQERTDTTPFSISGQRTEYRWEQENPVPGYGGSEQSPDALHDPLAFFNMDLGAPEIPNNPSNNYSQYDDSITFNTGDAHQLFNAPPPQRARNSTYDPSQRQTQGVNPPNVNGPASGTMYEQTSTHQPMEQQQAFPYRELHTDRTYPHDPPAHP